MVAQDFHRLHASLASEVDVDYTHVNPEWGVKHYTSDDFAALWTSEEHLGLKAMATQHFLGQPYFASITEREIVVEWQQVAFHGRKVPGEDYTNPRCKITDTSDGHSYMKHRFVLTERGWRIAGITPVLIFGTGDFEKIRKQDDR